MSDELEMRNIDLHQVHKNTNSSDEGVTAMDIARAIKLLRGGKDGIQEWNRLRSEGESTPTLSKVNLSGTNLCEADLRGTDLQEANLSGAELVGVHLGEANLVGVDFTGANLDSANLREANLQLADLTEVLLHKADLRKANLVSAKLGGANLAFANLQESWLSMATLTNAHLVGADFSGARLDGVQLQQANLENAQLKGSDLREANFSEANLKNADLSAADLRKANLQKACLEFSSLTDSDFREIGRGRWYHVFLPFYREPFRLNSTKALRTRFEPAVADPWSVLRANYTGSKLAFVLIFTVAAFLPLLLQAIFWGTVSRAEEQVLAVSLVSLSKASDALTGIENPTASMAAWVERCDEVTEKSQPWLDAYVRRKQSWLPDADNLRELFQLIREGGQILGETRKGVKEFQDRVAELDRAASLLEQAEQIIDIVHPAGKTELQQRHVYELVLGTHRGVSTVFFSSLLLIYNIGRIVLTNRLGALRDAEDRTGDSPAWSDYGYLWKMHRIIAPILAISVVFGAISIGQLLLTKVIVLG